MKEGYWLFGGLILFHFGRVVYSYYYRWQYKKADVEIADVNYDAYLDLRRQTFAITPADLGLTLPDNIETAFVIIMEIHTGTVIESIVVFSTGEVWIYNSKNPLKYISEQSDELKTAALAAIATAQYHYARMRRNNKDELLAGHIKFHILTNQDIYSAGDPINVLIDKLSEWEELFVKACAVVDECNNASKSKRLKRVYPKFKIKRTKPANL